MRTRSLFLSAGLVVGAALLFVGCPKKGGGGDDPCAEFSGVCVDLTPYVVTEGTGAVVRTAAAGDFLEGSTPDGAPGDYLLQNDRIRVIVQGDVRSSGTAPWGGNIIDADIVRPGGESHDELEELFMLINLGRTLKPDEFKIFADGSEGGSAILAVAGHDTVNDVLNVPMLLRQNLGDTLGQIWLDPEVSMSANVTTYYILNPGETRVRMVTAIRNDSSATYPIVLVDQFGRGGKAEVFNPSRATGSRFGYPEVVPEAADTYVAHVTPHNAYAYCPVEAHGRSPGANLAMTVSGVTSVLIGGENLFDFTGTEVPAPLPAGARDLPPGEVAVFVRDFYVGADHAAVVADWEEDNGGALGSVSGTVTVPGGVPAETRVAALAGGKPYATFAVADDGSYSGRLLAGDYELQVDAPGYPFSTRSAVSITGGGSETADLAVPAAGRVTVSVARPGGAPTPAKVTFICPGTCPKDLRSTGGLFRESGYDPLPASVQHVGFVGVTGTATFTLPPGDYQVVVSRGPMFSTFPAGWPTEVHAITVAAGATETVDAEIAKVVDTVGWLGGDLHVHAINSPDSPVPNLDRVASMLAEGVDVMVATDHDYVTDFTPWIEQLSAGNEMAHVVGNELTTFDWGHFNAFPRTHDPAAPRGGALDWGRGEDYTMTPAELFNALKAGSAETVIQVNHPRGGLGYFSSIGVDFATGKTQSDPTDYRMSPDVGGADDTGLFDTGFTAIEILNGHSVGSFVTRFNDWIALLQRGVNRTATAVSDTHRWFTGDMGNPLSWVQVGAGADTPASFDEAGFVAAINDGKVMGTNGPFVKVTASSGGSSAGLGETLSLATAGAAVDIDVTVEVASWYGFDTIELYSNITGTDSRPYEEKDAMPTPTDSASVDLSAETTIPGNETSLDAGTLHRRYVVTRTFTVNPTEDAWYVVVVRGTGVTGFPVILSGAAPLAYTNALFVDGDADGVYQAPESFQMAPRRAGLQRGPKLEKPAHLYTRDDLLELWRAGGDGHGH